MLRLGLLLVGPLATPECRRALARGWVILVRCLAACAVLTVTLLVLWWWWVVAQTEPYHSPFPELRVGLATVEGMLVTIALVMGPAVMAGSLAGERERGVLSLLLTTRVSAREVVTGRLVGKMTQVSMILLACVPAVVLLGSLTGINLDTLVVLIFLPVSVAWGGGGIAALASTVSRRGRDALLTVYLLDLLFLLGPLLGHLGFPRGALDWIAAINPYTGLVDLAWREDGARAGVSIGFWLVAGVGSVALASWRLRPACLAAANRASVRGPGKRGRWVPPVDELRPMLWKELFVERVGSLGQVGTWIGRLLVGGLLGSSIAFTTLMAWNVWHPVEPSLVDWARSAMRYWVGDSGTLLCDLIQWAIGIRAAVSISSERERGTWDALLTSPLEPREIVRGKVWGNLYALRWLILACLLTWWMGVGTGVLPPGEALKWTATTFVVGAFMAAVGVRTSLSSATATRAMAITIGVWLGAIVAVAFLAFFTLALLMLLGSLVWVVIEAATGTAAPAGFWQLLPWRVGWPFANLFFYAVGTVVVVIDTRTRFDRLAGRLTGGRLAVKLDEFLYGRPAAPVPADKAGSKSWSDDELPGPPDSGLAPTEREP